MCKRHLWEEGRNGRCWDSKNRLRREGESESSHHRSDRQQHSNFLEALLRSLFFVSICASLLVEICSLTKGMCTQSASSFGDQFRQALGESASNG